MAKEKLFTPEDFDKPSNPKSGLLKKCLIGIAVVAVIGLVIWGIASIYKNNNETPNGESMPTPVGIAIEPTDPIETDSVIVNTVEESVVETIEEEAESMVKGTPKPIQQVQQVSNDVEKEAMNVIRGDYGNNPQRRQRLGINYQPIQNRVNQLKKEGVF